MNNREERGRAIYRQGRSGEQTAALWLWLKGYRVLGRNLRTPFGEIDLLARRGKNLVVLEVKTRSDLSLARAAIHPTQRHRLLRALAWLISRRPDFEGLQPRCDALLIAPRHWPRHVVNAFADKT